MLVYSSQRGYKRLAKGHTLAQYREKYPDAIKAPSIETMRRWHDQEGGCEATDGCWVEPDGYCAHGCSSWLLVAGLI